MKTVEAETLQQVRERLFQHPIYAAVNTADQVRTFMQYHVFAVWDFMSLLKKMQMIATRTSVPWIPEKPALFARFINDIMLGEESDEDGHGGFTSHFELYLEAMKQVGADTTAIVEMVERLKQGVSWEEALIAENIPAFVREFVSDTMAVVFEGEPHEVASAFFYGREHIIPTMFSSLIEEIEAKSESVERLVYYLNRHVELDNDRHGPMAKQLLDFLCDQDPKLTAVAEQVAVRCLQSRIRLWDGVLKVLENSK